MDVKPILAELKQLGSEVNRQGMGRFGINVDKAYGVSMAQLYPVAKRIKKNHELALALWETQIHEARLLAIIIADAKQFDDKRLDQWVQDIDSWDLCDQFMLKQVHQTPFAWDKVYQWSQAEYEFVKRAAFALIAVLAVHDKKAPDIKFLNLLSLIKAASTDERNFVKKAVNWALRHIGKRNPQLHPKALELAVQLSNSESKAARWIGKDAVRELNSEPILKRLNLLS
jgi:3-methyladenine DNA glycosylase AlkD